MIQATFHFPRGFLWGTATSSHQVEGNNTNNNWWAWEAEPDHIINGDKSSLACDWWGGRWREDLDRAADAGQNAHRFSIEWSRIQPSPDRWDEDALDRYREIVRGMTERNMTPLVTLHHFSDPLWLAEMGGWENEQVVDYFVAYVKKVVEALKEYVNLWVTINEPNILSTHAYLLGVFPPGKKSLSSFTRVTLNMVIAHAVAYHAIHKIQPTARVGIATNYNQFRPLKAWSPIDRWVAGLHRGVVNNAFPQALVRGALRLSAWSKRVPEAKNTQDFLGINYYTCEMVSLKSLTSKDRLVERRFPKGVDISPNGFIANVPEGMLEALQWGRQFKIPIIITENGTEDAQDKMRPRYLIQHLHQVWRAVNFNWPVKGYFCWTLVDNFEWDRGWAHRWGLWELNIETQARRKRPSADLYAEICQTNGISSETVARYSPELLPLLFPG